MSARKIIRPYAYCIQRALDLLDANPYAVNDDYELVNRIQGAIYFHGRDAAGLSVPMPPVVQWNLIMRVLHHTRVMCDIREAFDEFFEAPEMQWPYQPGEPVVLLYHADPPAAVHGGVYRVLRCEHRPMRPVVRHGDIVSIAEAHDVVFIETKEGEKEIRAEHLTGLLNEDPSGFVHRAYTIAWALTDRVPDNPMFKDLHKEVVCLREELRAAVGAVAYQMTDPESC